ncbi:hypothetical protein TNIN_90931 [Trichonephila inaurata madagascariensis]|uniref:Uncharacterized protein n=1 Tax=Trichonephila inaurata madagascariensis TaxID=2747483 RepID=A0A8X7BRU6_9ARAC|nr:hypothetical protein TNIN_366471 [Trichonephila inaurata madagascariensis]GFY64278.1 hypothetical protein TNIN_90931 [Trichonephila inaurata madagascariensis]
MNVVYTPIYEIPSSKAIASMVIRLSVRRISQRRSTLAFVVEEEGCPVRLSFSHLNSIMTSSFLALRTLIKRGHIVRGMINGLQGQVQMLPAAEWPND